MSRFVRLGTPLAVTAVLAACVDGQLAIPGLPGATPTPGTPAAAGVASPLLGSKVLADTAELLVIQQIPPKGDVWLGLPRSPLLIPENNGYQAKARLLVKNAVALPPITWSSSDATIVKVEKGFLTGLKKGTATITATALGQTATMIVQIMTIEEIGAAVANEGVGAGTGTGSGTTAGGPIKAGTTLPGELADGRKGAAAIVLNAGTLLFVVAGSDGNQALNTWETSPGLGDVETDTGFTLELRNYLKQPREGLAAVTAGRHLYLLGGAKSGAERLVLGDTAKPSEDVDVGLSPRKYAAVAETDAMVVVAGGLDMDNKPTDSVQVATKRASTDVTETALGRFRLMTATLPVPLAGATAAILGDNLLVVGGAGADGKPVDTILRARITGETIGAFETLAGKTLFSPRAYHAMVAHNGHLYAAGGIGKDGGVDDMIERIRVDSSGNVGLIEPVQKLAAKRKGAAGVVFGVQNPDFYVIGGDTGAGVTRDVEVFSLRALETAVAIATRPTPTPTPTPTPSASGSASPSPSGTATPAPTASSTTTPTPTTSP